MSIRVLIADDQELVRTGFRMILTAAGDIEVVGEAANGQDAVVEARASSPDVVLMDVRMPVLDGIAATREIIRRSGADAPRIVILTTFDLDQYVYDAPPPERPPGLDDLTPRELEIMRHVARGMSNLEIANELIIGEATVKTHVARVLMKLGLRNRVQAVVLAYEAGIVLPGKPSVP